jgi:hypothetical protein
MPVNTCSPRRLTALHMGILEGDLIANGFLLLVMTSPPVRNPLLPTPARALVLGRTNTPHAAASRRTTHQAQQHCTAGEHGVRGQRTKQVSPFNTRVNSYLLLASPICSSGCCLSLDWMLMMHTVCAMLKIVLFVTDGCCVEPFNGCPYLGACL